MPEYEPSRSPCPSAVRSLCAAAAVAFASLQASFIWVPHEKAPHTLSSTPILSPRLASSTDTQSQRIVLKLVRQPSVPPSQKDSGSASLDRLMDRFAVSKVEMVFDLSRGDPASKALFGLGKYIVLTLPAGFGSQEVIRAFAADPAVELAEPDFVGWGGGVPDDPTFDQQWNLNNTGQAGGTPDADVDAPEAWDLSIGSAATILAVIDTGVDLDHPELASKLVAGYDFANGDADPQDDYGHGTHVAGIIAAASNNGQGIAGLCWAC
jgi:subtilisin family serine protease